MHSARTAFGIVVLAALVCLAAPARAHRVNVFAWHEDGKVFTESSFGGGRKAMGAVIEVRDAATDKVLLTGETDKDGLFAFDVPELARQEGLDLLIMVKAGAGHQGDWTMRADEYLGAAVAAPPESAQSAETAPAVAEQAAPPAVAGVDAQELARIVDQAVERRIGPLARDLAAMRDRGVEPRDVVGGIGYLVGLAGLAAWLRARRERI